MNSIFITSSLGEPLNSIKEFLKDAHDEVMIIVPYIKEESLRQIIPDDNLKVTIITTWKVQDLWMKSSDLSLYPFTKERSIKFFINNRIHLKVFMIDWHKCIFGSANISRRGLGITENFNYELNTIQPSIDSNTLLYFRYILADSVLMSDKIYEEYRQKVHDLPQSPEFPEVALDIAIPDTEFLISSLPMSRDINMFYELYANNFSSDDKETKECAMHDVALYKIPFGLTKEEFMSHLKHQFIKSPFINKLLEYIDEEERYFGRVKAWIQSNCKDVPIPSRRDLTGNIQVLYKWIVQLSEGKYLVDTPKHSERIYRAK